MVGGAESSLSAEVSVRLPSWSWEAGTERRKSSSSSLIVGGKGGVDLGDRICGLGMGWVGDGGARVADRSADWRCGGSESSRRQATTCSVSEE